MQPVSEFDTYSNYIKELLRNLETGSEVSIEPKTQFAVAYLCDLFEVSSCKNVSTFSYMSLSRR